jgi:ankyrin repeat protein
MMRITFLACLGLAAAQSDTPLHTAARADDPEKVEALITEGAELNVRGNGGQTPIMAATLGGATKAFKVLLEKGADTSIGEKDGYTPYHGAGFQGRAEIARLLKAHGLDPLDTHSDGYIGLHRACWGREQRHTDTVRAFLKMGVDAEHKAQNGKTCLDMTPNEATKKFVQGWLDRKKKKATEL